MSTNRTRAIPPGLQTLFHAGSLVGVTDGQLLERFALRDGEPSEAAFAALVERHEGLVWRTCRFVLRDEHDAADAFQATFLVLVRKAGSLWVRDSLAPWLHRVAMRAANQARLEATRRRETERRAAELRAGWTEDAMTDDLADVIHQEIDRLPERHRIVVVLCDLEGRSYDEAARHLRCPVGTVKSRLARARERLREALIRRGVMPTAGLAAFLRDAMAAVETPPLALTASTIRGSVWFGMETTRAAGAISNTAIRLMEGVLRTMIRAKLQKAILLVLAAFGLLVPAWLVHARQTTERPGAQAPAASQKNVERPINLAGHWILRGYPSGGAFGVIKIEGPRQQPRVTLLDVTQREFTHLAESKIDRFRTDDEAVRFALHLGPANPIQSRTMDVVVYLSGDRAGPDALWGSIEWDGQGQYPAKLERTDRTEIDRQEGPEPAVGVKELHQVHQTRDPARQREVLEEVIEKYSDTPAAQCATSVMALVRADAGAPPEEVRGLIGRAVRYAARYGREMEVGEINVIVRALAGREDLEGFLLDYARKAVDMLRPATDAVNLQEAALKNLALVLRKAVKIDETKARAEAKALDSRIAALPRGAGPDRARVRRVAPTVPSDKIPWARNFASARKQARAEGKLIMVDFCTGSCDWCQRLDAEVFPSPKVAEALRPFVPVKVDADDGEGRPLLERYHADIPTGPAFLFLDPAADGPKDARIVGKIIGFLPAAAFVEQLNTVAGLPRDINKLMGKVHPDDGDAMRRLATALAMQGRVKDAAALIGRAWGPGADRNFDRWAAVYNTIADEVMMQMRPGAEDRDDLDNEELGGRAMALRRLVEAAGWYGKAARLAKRPVDVYNAHLGAGFVAALQDKGAPAARELEAAARVDGVSDGERAFARELLGDLAEPPDGSPEAAAAIKRLEAKSPSKPGATHH